MTAASCRQESREPWWVRVVAGTFYLAPQVHSCFTGFGGAGPWALSGHGWKGFSRARSRQILGGNMEDSLFFRMSRLPHTGCSWKICSRSQEAGYKQPLAWGQWLTMCRPMAATHRSTQRGGRLPVWALRVGGADSISGGAGTVGCRHPKESTPLSHINKSLSRFLAAQQQKCV